MSTGLQIFIIVYCILFRLKECVRLNRDVVFRGRVAHVRYTDVTGVRDGCAAVLP
jgi:hypothetical protein